MQKRPSMEDARAVFLEHFVVCLGAVALMLLEAIERILCRKFDHQSIADDFCCDGSE